MSNFFNFQLESIEKREKSMFENINVDWNLSHDDGSTDFSDDDTVIDERVSSCFNLKYSLIFILFIIISSFNYLFSEWKYHSREKESLSATVLCRWDR